MKLIAKNLKGDIPKVVLGPLFKLFEAILELMVPLVMANMIDIGVKNRDAAYIWQGGLKLVAIALVSAGAALVCQYFAALAAGRFGGRLRRQAYGHVLRLSGGDMAAFGTGGLITRITNDTQQIQTGLNMTIRLATRAPFLAIGGMVMAIGVNRRVGLIFLAVTPLIALVLYFIMRRTLPSYGRIQAGQDGLARLAGENLAGARVIRAFSRQKQEQEEFAEKADELTALTVRVGRVSAALNPITSVVISLAIVAVVWMGGGLVFGGELQPGQVIALVSYMNQILLAMIVAANMIVLMTRALASCRRVADLLETSPTVTDGPGAQEDAAAPAIRFEDVSFAYHAGADDALEHASFAVEKGETLGIIGGTGAGKTTLVNLILRYFDVGAGRVLVNGADVRDYTLGALRGKIGLVPQRAALLGGTVRSNLLVGAGGKQAADAALWQALKQAQAADFVENMPGGLDARVEEGGKNLSGGQKQRLTIARALVRRPQILILDDAASALDYATEAALRAALRQESRETGMTTLIISQRAASIRHADLILVLDEGELAGMGSHEELYKSNAIYREICQSQDVDGEGVADFAAPAAPLPGDSLAPPDGGALSPPSGGAL